MNNKEKYWLIKVADAGQAITDPIGPLQNAYISKLVGLDAVENATDLQFALPDIAKGK